MRNMTEEPPSNPESGADAAGIVIDVSIKEKAWLDQLPWLEALAGEAARDACLAAGIPAAPGNVVAEISLIFAADGFLQRLNAQHRGIDKPTNVLSFPTASSADIERFKGNRDDGAENPPELLLGDVALGFETISKEAADQGKRLADHVAHLVSHGVLHLLGFDHAGDNDASRMERLETRIMENMGIGDPYAEPPAPRGDQ